MVRVKEKSISKDALNFLPVFPRHVLPVPVYQTSNVHKSGHCFGKNWKIYFLKVHSLRFASDDGFSLFQKFARFGLAGGKVQSVRILQLINDWRIEPVTL
jgi:hypothetical protein